MISKYRNTGQTCVCANRLYAQAGVYDAFARKLAEKVGAMKVGDGFEAGVNAGPLIDKKALAKVEEHIGDAVSKGAKVALGGKPDAGRDDYDSGQSETKMAKHDRSSKRGSWRSTGNAEQNRRCRFACEHQRARCDKSKCHRVFS